MPLLRRQARRGPRGAQAPESRSRYVRLDLNEQYLVDNQKHVLVAYSAKPRDGCKLVAAAVHFAAEATTGVEALGHGAFKFTEFEDSCAGRVYHASEAADSEAGCQDATGDVRIIFHAGTFDRSLSNGRASAASLLATILGRRDGMDQLERCLIDDVFIPMGMLRLFSGPAQGMADLWRRLGRTSRGHGMVLGASMRPRVGLVPKHLELFCRAVWQAGDLVLVGTNEQYCPLEKVMPLLVSAMGACVAAAGKHKLLIAEVAADTSAELLARGRYVLEKFGTLAPNCGFCVDARCTGIAALKDLRQTFPYQFLYYKNCEGRFDGELRRLRGYSAFVHSKLARMLGASGVEIDVAGTDEEVSTIFGMLSGDDSQGPVYKQGWQGMRPVAPIVSHTNLTALDLPPLFERLGHSDLLVLSGEGVACHARGPAAGTAAMRQAERAWESWREARCRGDTISLEDVFVDHAALHEELLGVFAAFPQKADRLYPGWKDRLMAAGVSVEKALPGASKTEGRQRAKRYRARVRQAQAVK